VARLTDEEVICTFMDERPSDGSGSVVTTPDSPWWSYSYEIKGGLFHWTWHPGTLTLERLWQVEERLSLDQAKQYDRLLNASPDYPILVWHCTPKQKITALAAVLRPIVERASQSPDHTTTPTT
jgi:hypothetical protein